MGMGKRNGQGGTGKDRGEGAQGYGQDVACTLGTGIPRDGIMSRGTSRELGVLVGVERSEHARASWRWHWRLQSGERGRRNGEGRRGLELFSGVKGALA